MSQNIIFYATETYSPPLCPTGCTTLPNLKLTLMIIAWPVHTARSNIYPQAKNWILWLPRRTLNSFIAVFILLPVLCSYLLTDLGPKRPQEEKPRRISFMSNESSPYTSLSTQGHYRRDPDIVSLGTNSPQYLKCILSQRSDLYGSWAGTCSLHSDNLGGHDTMLLNMVRAQSKELEEAQDRTLSLPQDGDESDDQSVEACMHGLSMRGLTDRSVSRSRFSRISTKRDMDIPSILAFTTDTISPTQLEIPAFQKINTLQQEAIPRWSIRRSVCPVCSLKWKDRSKICNIKYSGLKRSSLADFPSVIAPARLRAAITMAYVPRPSLAVVDENIAGIGIKRNPSATWQLTRARRFRAPKPVIPPPEATAPPSAAAPMARKDLDIRVHRFLSDEQ